MKMPTMGSPGMGQSPGGAADAGIKAAIKQMVVSVLDDESLDSKASMGRIIEILKSQERIMGQGTNENDPNAKLGEESDPLKGDEKPGEKKPAGEKSEKKFPESKEPTVAELLEENRRLKAEGIARKLLDDAGIESSQSLVEGVALHKDEAGMKKFIESMPKGRLPAPRSAAPRGNTQLRESKVPDGSDPEKVAAFWGGKKV